MKLFLYVLAGLCIFWGVRNWVRDSKVETPKPAPVVVSEFNPPTKEISVLLKETNKQRAAHNLGKVALKQSLTVSALLKCNDMERRNYWNHNHGDSTWKFFTDRGFLGENLAKGYKTPQEVVKAWMNSPEHRKNVLSPLFRNVGFGSCDGPQGHVVVEHFAS